MTLLRDRGRNAFRLGLLEDDYTLQDFFDTGERDPGTELEEIEAEKYEAFKVKYYDRPDLFAAECFEWNRLPRYDGPTVYQAKALLDLAEKRRLALRGPHGLGKTTFAAWAILWFALTRDGKDWKIPATASAWRQLIKYLFPEIHKWVRLIKWDQIGRSPFIDGKELLTLSIKLRTGEAFALASNQSEMIEGAHAEHLLYIFDEAKIIPDDTWDSAEGAFSTGDARWLAISTPGEPQGRFYKIHAKAKGYEDWSVTHVTLDDFIEAGHINEEWADQRREQWGEDSAVYQNRVLGNFASSSEDRVISLALIERANERWYKWEAEGKPGSFKCLGIDVGRGGNKSVIARRYDTDDDLRVISELNRLDRRNVMAISGRAAGILQKYWWGYAVVDAVGIGAGVVDRLREIRVGNNFIKAVAFVAGAKTDKKDRIQEMGFADCRAAAWWNLRELLEDDLVALPPDDTLTGDLTVPGWFEVSGGKIRVESKEQIKKKLNRSTDDGDAVVQALFEPKKKLEYSESEGLGQVDEFVSRWR